MTTRPADFFARNEGTIWLLHPLTEAGEQWLDEHIAEDATYFGSGLVIEHRYVRDVLEGIVADGLELAA